MDPKPSSSADAERTSLIAAEVACQLEQEKQRIYTELRSYPPPITACDQQFNYLLERQATVNAALSRLNAAMAECDPAKLSKTVAEVQQSVTNTGVIA
jgi:hypothetical protein